MDTNGSERHTVRPLAELDPAKVGYALMRIGCTSVQLGHQSIYGTVDPYLLSAPNGAYDAETQFVIDLLHKDPADVIPLADVIAMGRNRPPWYPDRD